MSTVQHGDGSKKQASVKNHRILFDFDLKLTQTYRYKFLILRKIVTEKCHALGVKSGPLKLLFLKRSKEQQIDARCIWEVTLSFTANNKQCYVNGGWVPFLERNGLNEGDVLRLYLHSPNIWSVRLLYRHSSQASSLLPPHLPKMATMPIKQEQEEVASESSSILPQTRPEKRKQEEMAPSARLPKTERTMMLVKQDREEIREEPLTIISHERAAVFHLVIEQRHLQNPHILEVPRQFASRMPNRKCVVNVKCKSPRSFNAIWIYSNRGTSVLQGVLADVGVDVGDLLVVELTDASLPTLELHVYKEGCGRAS